MTQNQFFYFLFIMLTENNQIFRNCFIIYCHLTKVSSQINKSIIFEPNELDNTIYSMYIESSYTEVWPIGCLLMWDLFYFVNDSDFD